MKCVSGITYLHLARSCTALSRRATAGAWCARVPRENQRLIFKQEEEKILKELENSDIVLDRDKLKGIFSDSESDSDCDTNMTSDSDDVNNDNFYKLTTVKGKNHDKEFDI